MPVLPRIVFDLDPDPTFVLESDRLRPLRANYLDLRSAPPDVDGPIHFPIDSHINARGHRWVADELRKAPVAATSAGPARPRR
jgi:hypothetical protein